MTDVPAPAQDAEPTPVGRTFKELRDHEPEKTPWLVPGMLSVGSTTELNGREKAGKGYFVAHLVASLEKDAESVLGTSSVGPVRTMYYTEEPPSALKEKGDRFGIENAFVVYHWELDGPWFERVPRLVEHALEQKCGMLFVDNISRATGTEDEAGVELARKIEPLAMMARQYELTVLYDRHQRKSGGKTEDLSRGSTALAGSIDNIVAMEKRGRAGSRERKLTSWGRLWESSWEAHVELDEENWTYRKLEGDFKQRLLLERDFWTVKDFAKAIKQSEDSARSYLQESPLVEEDGRDGKAVVYSVHKPPSLD